MEHSQVLLNKQTYPLYVGGRRDQSFEDWDEKGSSVLLQASVVSNRYGAADLCWWIQDPDIAAFDSPEDSTPASRRVRARRTGVTRVSAALPDGTEASCVLTVIDSYARLTTAAIELNTDRLILAPGKEARLIPILYPKDLFENGMLNPALTWESDNKKAVSVREGVVHALSCGEANITVRTVDTGRTACCHITVLNDENVQTEDSDQIHAVQEITVGEFLSLPSGNREVCWRSENRYVADVDSHGAVFAAAPSLQQTVGNHGLDIKEIPEPVTVFATQIHGGAVMRYPILVRPATLPCHSVTIFPDTLNLPIGKSAVLEAICDPLVQDGRILYWESNDSQVLSVTPIENNIYGAARARVTALRPGEAAVTVSYQGKKSTCTIIITEQAERVSQIILPEQTEMEIDQVLSLNPSIPGHPANPRLHWLSADQTIATADREGTIQGYAEGSCDVYAFADDSLSEEQKQILENIRKKGEKRISLETISALTDGTICTICEVQVQGGKDVLRNIHVVPEAITDHSILVLWNRAALNRVPAFDHYRVSVNGKAVAKTPNLGWRFDSLLPETDYHFTVEVISKDGTVLAAYSLSAETKPASPLVNVMDFGALGDGSTLDTVFIQRAINACPENGTVLLPEGHVFLSGALFLKSHMTFQVDGVLLGSTDPKDYSRIITKWEGWRRLEQGAADWNNSTETLPDNHCPHSSLLNAGGYAEGESSGLGPYTIENLTICGKGQINANGFALAYNEGPNRNTARVASVPYPIQDASSRGSAIRIHNGKNIYLYDVQVAYAPGWTVHPIYCQHLTCDGMEIVSQGDGDIGLGTDVLNCGHIFNGDGIDPESCVHVNLFNILFTTGDDAVAIKSGRGREGNELDKPNGYIRVTDCQSIWSLGGFGTGSETAAGSHDLLFQNLWISGILVSGIWLKTNPFRGGVTEHIQVRDVWAEKCNSPVWIYHGYSIQRVQFNPSLRPPIVRHLAFENVHGDASNELGFRLEGEPALPIQDIQLIHVSAGGRENRISSCENLTITEGEKR